MSALPRHRQPCDGFTSHAQLAPDSRWCKEHAEECAVLTPLIDLTGYEFYCRPCCMTCAQPNASVHFCNLHSPIGTKRFCTVGSERDHECDEVISTEDDGVHLVFEARGATNPLDSPSALFVTDISEDGCVYLNGGELPKKIAVQVRLGGGNRLQVCIASSSHRCSLVQCCSWGSTLSIRCCATIRHMHDLCREESVDRNSGLTSAVKELLM